MNKPDSRLLIKATCKKPVQISIPNVEVINGLISDEEMEKIHALGDCYVSFSSSEGVGMDADRKSTRSELQSHHDLVCRLLLEKKNKK